MTGWMKFNLLFREISTKKQPPDYEIHKKIHKINFRANNEKNDEKYHSNIFQKIFLPSRTSQCSTPKYRYLFRITNHHIKLKHFPDKLQARKAKLGPDCALADAWFLSNTASFINKSLQTTSLHTNRPVTSGVINLNPIFMHK